jgi:hypothetical protein
MDWRIPDEGLSFHEGSAGKVHLVARTIIQEEPGWLKAALQEMKKTSGLPKKRREEAQVSERSTQRFEEYNPSAVNSDNIGSSSYERGHPGGDG